MTDPRPRPTRPLPPAGWSPPGPPPGWSPPGGRPREEPVRGGGRPREEAFRGDHRAAEEPWSRADRWPPDGPPRSDRWRRAGRAAARGGVAVGRGGRVGVTYLASRLLTASAPAGARESGLTALIWNQVLSLGADAMVTVALAGTVFFGASPDAQRGNVLEYLLVTMAPFALVAPVIGPVMDRLQHGRRIAMAVTAIGRAALALVMAAHFDNLLVLFPCALGSLVLSKAYTVVRAAAAPRLVPPGMTLVEANSRLSVFALGAGLVGGGLVGAVIKVTGSYAVGLVLTALAFGATAYSSLRLPRVVDAVGSARRASPPPGPAPRRGAAGWGGRLAAWAARGFGPAALATLRTTCGLRFLTGFLTLFLAFWVQGSVHGWTAAAELGAVIAGAGLGNAAGNVAGARVRPSHPERVALWCGVAAAAVTLLGAAVFSPLVAVVVIVVASAAASLAKVGLDSVIQRDVAEAFRSSGFGRSEAFLQLSWVLGGTIALLLPSTRGWLGLLVAGVVVTGVVVAVTVTGRARPARRPARGAGDPGGWPPSAR